MVIVFRLNSTFTGIKVNPNLRMYLRKTTNFPHVHDKNDIIFAYTSVALDVHQVMEGRKLGHFSSTWEKLVILFKYRVNRDSPLVHSDQRPLKPSLRANDIVGLVIW